MASIWNRFDQTESVVKPREGILSLSAETSKYCFADWAKFIERNLNSWWSTLKLRSRCHRLLLPWPVLEFGSHCIYNSKRLLSVGRLLLYGVEYCDEALIDSYNTVEHEAAVELPPPRLHRAKSGCLNAPNMRTTQVPRNQRPTCMATPFQASF